MSSDKEQLDFRGNKTSKTSELSTEWSLCIFCQKSNNVKLVCPADSKRNNTGVGYSSLSDNLNNFLQMGNLPCNLKLERLDDGQGLATTHSDHNAKWHKNCRDINFTMWKKAGLVSVIVCTTTIEGMMFSFLGSFFPQLAMKKQLTSLDIGIIMSTFPCSSIFVMKIESKVVFYSCCVLCRVIQGASNAVLLGSTYSVLVNELPDYFTVILGIRGTAYGFGTTIGPLFAGILFDFSASATQAGSLLMAFGLFYAVSSTIVGILLKYYNVPILFMVCGSLVVAFGILILGPAPFLPIKPSIWLVLASLIVIGTSSAFVDTPGASLAFNSVVEDFNGDTNLAINFISTTFIFCRSLGRLSPLEVDGNALKIALRCVGAIVITSGKYNMFTYVSLTEGSVMLAVSSAILVYISSCVFLKHMLTIKDVVCMVAAIGGTILANIEELLQDRSFDLDILKGYLFGTASAIGYGFSAVVSNKMGTLPVTILMFYLLITQMLFNWFMVIILQETILIYDSMLYINLFGLVVVFYITQYCLNKGLQVGNPTYCLIGGIGGGKGNCQQQDQTNILHILDDTYNINDQDVGISNVALIGKYDLADRRPMQSDHDYSDSPSITNLSEFKEAAITYIAGYVARKVKQITLCSRCCEALGSQKHATDSSFLKLKDRGGLFKPTQSVIEICKVTEQRFQRMLASTNGKLPQVRYGFYVEGIDPEAESCTVDMPAAIHDAFRPPVNCSMCSHVTEVEHVSVLTAKLFEERHAYSGRPVVIVDGTNNWTAPEVFSFNFFKQLYPEDSPVRGDQCQFFPYQTSFESLNEVFNMTEDRANLRDGSNPWYIGWSNCDQEATDVLRRHYQRPYFLPPQSESSKTDWIFMGSPGYGAHMHIDHVGNPSWQAQIKGQKLWTLEPPPECFLECQTLKVIVNPGEIIVLDTNRWFHKTLVLGDSISITIGSEYD
ncbi:Bifunctional arginine demethylase and lysyl-hydroxylase JMJD6 [Nymphon striatum]|nr:Bifunctional arginine demethylase and lysyl-hydroxylase JMJD6 [Nymphon striatum]